MDQNDLAWTAFRASFLAPLLTGEVTSAERGAYFHKLASQEHTLPSGKRAKISLRTLRRWYQQVREAGIDRLKPLSPDSDFSIHEAHPVSNGDASRIVREVCGNKER